jgi:hypothetical protein
VTRLFAHHRGRHCRHGSLTGWSSLSLFFPPPAADCTRRRIAPPAIAPYPSEETP